MAIFLSILKIIGITLLIILGILLLILLLVMFVPIRYRLTAHKGDDKDVNINIGINWLLHIISVKLQYDVLDLYLSIKVLGITIKKKYLYGVQKKLIDEQQSETATDNIKDSHSKVTADNIDKSDKHNISEPSLAELNDSDNGLYKLEGFENISSNEISNNYTEDNQDNQDYINNDELTAIQQDNITVNEDTEHADDINDIEAINTKDDVNDIDKDSIDKKSLTDRIADLICSIIKSLTNTYNKIKNTIDGLVNNTEASINKVKKEYHFYEKFINDEKNKQAIKLGTTELLKILKSIRPKSIKGNIEFGFEDPAKTGQVLGYISMLYPILYNKISVNPIFDKPLIHGNIKIKGKITLFVLIIALLRVYFNKNIKRMMAIYKRHKNK